MIALTKLMDNAFKFTREGSITIEASVKELNSSTSNNPVSSMLQVSITDTGVGIESEQLEFIFEQFFQEEDFMCRQVGGGRTRAVYLQTNHCPARGKTMGDLSWEKSRRTI